MHILHRELRHYNNCIKIIFVQDPTCDMHGCMTDLVCLFTLGIKAPWIQKCVDFLLANWIDVFKLRALISFDLLHSHDNTMYASV